MFFVLTRRVIKHNTGATEKYTPRTANRESWEVSGPFRKIASAERGVMLCLQSHTCLSARVVTIEQLEELSKKEQGYGLRNLIEREVKPLLEQV